jgi:WD40-like Beta Propeller Repeat
MASSRYAVDVSPSNVNVRTRVHEYGGGAVVPGKGQVFFSDFATQQIFQQNLSMGDAEVALKPITPDDDPDHPHRFRFADGVLDSSGSKINSIREDHFHDEPSKVVNEIVSINVETGEMTVLASGNDFYSNPRLAPDGKHLAYVTWNHPNMPWDSTELCVLDFETLSTSKIAGDGDSSIIQPVWHPVTNHLYYLSDRSGYYNLYVAGSEESILPDMSLMTGLSWTDLPNGLQTYRLRRQRK